MIVPPTSMTQTEPMILYLFYIILEHLFVCGLIEHCQSQVSGSILAMSNSVRELQLSSQLEPEQNCCSNSSKQLKQLSNAAPTVPMTCESCVQILRVFLAMYLLKILTEQLHVLIITNYEVFLVLGTI